MITLLHEFGHIIDLLPQDADNLDGQSVRNTDEVMRHCRPEVEARSKQASRRAGRISLPARGVETLASTGMVAFPPGLERAGKQEGTGQKP